METSLQFMLLQSLLIGKVDSQLTTAGQLTLVATAPTGPTVFPN
jgi:hypothetical protein